MLEMEAKVDNLSQKSQSPTKIILKKSLPKLQNLQNQQHKQLKQSQTSLNEKLNPVNSYANFYTNSSKPKYSNLTTSNLSTKGAEFQKPLDMQYDENQS